MVEDCAFLNIVGAVRIVFVILKEYVKIIIVIRLLKKKRSVRKNIIRKGEL